MRKKKKRAGGRPKKAPAERASAQIGLNARPEEVKILEEAVRRWNDELQNSVLTTNRQALLRLLIKKLGKQLKDKDFSIVQEYMINGH